MPEGQAVSKFWSGIFFFFVVVRNRHINLCIKTCPPLVGMYYSDCLQQKRPNQNLLFGHISRERGPTHPFLCAVKLSFDLFIKPTSNSTLSQKGFIVLIVLNKNSPIEIYNRGVYHEGGNPLISTCVTSKQVIISEDCFCSMAATCMNLRLRSAVFRKKTNVFRAVNRNNDF